MKPHRYQLLFILFFVSLSVVACQRPATQPTSAQPLTVAPAPTQNPLFRDNLDGPLQAIDALESLGVE